MLKKRRPFFGHIYRLTHFNPCTVLYFIFLLNFAVAIRSHPPWITSAGWIRREITSPRQFDSPLPESWKWWDGSSPFQILEITVISASRLAELCKSPLPAAVSTQHRSEWEKFYAIWPSANSPINPTSRLFHRISIRDCGWLVSHTCETSHRSHRLHISLLSINTMNQDTGVNWRSRLRNVTKRIRTA